MFPKRIILKYKKNYREESYILFTKVWQLKLLRKAKQIFIDATFIICPKGYYQLLNKFVSIEGDNLEISLYHTLMTNKSTTSYEKVFEA